MSKAPKYRIKEKNGLFEIEILDYRNDSLFPWYHKDVYEWGPVNIQGKAPKGFFEIACESFNNLDEAKKRVELFKKGTVYHY